MAAYQTRSGCPAHTRPVPFDDVELARRARTALAATDRARLVVADGGPSGCVESTVPVHDDSGEAFVMVRRDSADHDAARRRRHAALLIDADPDYGVGVTLVGRLTERRIEPGINCGIEPGIEPGMKPGMRLRAEPPDLVAISLTVDRVLASCPHDRVSVLTRDRRSIPLDLYALVEPDLVAVVIARLVPHLNQGHTEQVRALAAHASGTAVAEIAGAHVSHLCRESLRLWWVGRSGATEQPFGFPRPARRSTTSAASFRNRVHRGSPGEPVCTRLGF